jgi:hypothetical protein
MYAVATPKNFSTPSFARWSGTSSIILNLHAERNNYEVRVSVREFK